MQDKKQAKAEKFIEERIIEIGNELSKKEESLKRI